MIRRIGMMTLSAFTASALADEAAVRRMIEPKLRGGASIESIERTYAGLYEVVIRSDEGPILYYVDESASIIIIGKLIDAKSGRNLTDERQRRLSVIRWDSLPFHWALSTTRGTGRRKIAVFSDPNCPYCKRFEADLAKLDDITVHIFLYPVIRAESVTQTRSVWCSQDRVRAWNDLMLRGIQPAAAPDCDTPIDALVQLGRRLGAHSTPTWLLETGERFSGARPPEEIKRLLDTASPGKP